MEDKTARRPASGGLGYEPQLDGLRAISVMAVLAYHAGAAFFGGGFLGVDIFFVLSGFLITTLLVQEHEATSRISLPKFYGRRVRRLVPALALVVVVSAIGFGVTGAGFQEPTVREAPAAFFYVISWLRALQRIDGAALTHTWSLSVEEHFYLVWPVLVGVLLRRSRRTLVFGVTTVAVTSTLYAVWLASTDVSFLRLYFAPDARFHQIAIGCLLSVFLKPALARRPAKRSLLLDGAAAVAAALIIGAFLLARMSARAYYLGYGVVFCVAAATVIAHLVVWPRSVPARALASPFAVWIGKRSYGIYLWQVPAIALTERLMHVGRIPEYFVGVAMTFAVAGSSYRWLELPAQQWRTT